MFESSMSGCHPNDVPDESWPLDRLATFCGVVGRRHAGDAWLLGRALNLARGRVKHGGWMGWVREHCRGVGRGTVGRYRLLAERFSLDEVRGMGLTEAYRRAGMVSARPAGPAPTVRSGRGAGRRARWCRGRPPAAVFPSWAVDGPRAAGGPPAAAAEAAPWDDDEMLSGAEAFAEEWADLPHLLRRLDDRLGLLLDGWDDHGPGVPSDLHDRAIASVREKLRMVAELAARTAPAAPPARPADGDEVVLAA